MNNKIISPQRHDKQRVTIKKTIATPALLSVAQRIISLRLQGRLIIHYSFPITHYDAAAGRTMLVAGL